MFSCRAAGPAGSSTASSFQAHRLAAILFDNPPMKRLEVAADTFSRPPRTILFWIPWET